MQGLAWLCRLGGFALVRRCGRLLGATHCRFDRRGRRDLEAQLAQSLQIGARPSADALRDAYRVNDGAVFEIISMHNRGLRTEELRKHCRIDGLDRLRRALAGGRGVVLLGMHMGNGFMMNARIAAEDLPLTAVYRESHKTTPGFFERLFARHGIAGIHVDDPARAYRQMRRALGEGRIVYVLMDQAAKDSGIPVQFLGKPVNMPGGPAELARRSGAPVLAALPVAATPAWQFTITEPLAFDGDEAADADAMSARFSALMEAHIRKYPQLWTWHHRRWRRFPFEDATVES